MCNCAYLCIVSIVWTCKSSKTHCCCFLFQKYRCWVYQRADLNRVLISQAVGAFCHIKQDVTSWNYTEGAVVALDMTEYERERKNRRFCFVKWILMIFRYFFRWSMSYVLWRRFVSMGKYWELHQNFQLGFCS